MSRIKLSRASWVASFRMVNGKELELPPLAILCGWHRRIFWPEAGILVLRRSLGKSKKACQIRENREICACGAKMYACGAKFLRLRRKNLRLRRKNVRLRRK